MILDKRRLVYALKRDSGDIRGCIAEITSIIRDNYLNMTEFQSIYDHHEYLISLVIDQLATMHLNITPDYLH